MSIVAPCKHGIGLGGYCPPCLEEAGRRFWEKQPEPPPDSRDAELAELRERLSDAEKTMVAMADDLEHTLGYASDYFREKWDLGESLKTFAEYNKKHGAP